MNEDNNQIIEEELDYYLPDDYEEEETVEDTTETEETEDVNDTETEEHTEEDVESESEEVSEESEQDVQEEVETSLEDLEIKFLHEIKKLSDYSADEVKEIFQKGLNNERLVEKVKLANEKTNKIKELAELYKMSDDDLIDTLYDQYFTATAEAQGKDKELIKQGYESSKKQATQKMYDKFLQSHSDVDVKSIPQEVWQAVQDGEDLSRAYDNHMKETTIQTKDSEISQLKKQLEEFEQKLKAKENNEKVKKKAVVKSTSKNGSEKVEDDFLAGFFG